MSTSSMRRAVTSIAKAHTATAMILCDGYHASSDAAASDEMDCAVA